MLRQTLLATAAVAALAFATPAFAQNQADQFRQGVADRTAWENWFNGLSGEYRSGALYWTGQRSKAQPGTCYSMGGDLGDFTQGCLAAQRMLAMSDVRRKSEPDYRIGWNAYTTSPTGYPVPTPYVPVAPAYQAPSTPAASSGDPALCMLTDAADSTIADAPIGKVEGVKVVEWHNIRMAPSRGDNTTRCTATVEMNNGRTERAEYSFEPRGDGTIVRVRLVPLY